MPTAERRPHLNVITDPDDIAAHVANWRYDEVRAAPLPHWGPQRLLAIEICNLIPFARWCYYQDLALAYNDTVRVLGLDYASHNAHTFALLVDDLDDRLAGRLSGITVPWHRMRDAEGLLRAKHVGAIYEPNARGNLDWRAEGGRLKGASAGQGQRIDLRLAMRRGELERPS